MGKVGPSIEIRGQLMLKMSVSRGSIWTNGQLMVTATASVDMSISWPSFRSISCPLTINQVIKLKIGSISWPSVT